jgi:hypothetical protein
MTRREYMHLARRPDYCGINARAELKRKAHLAMCDSMPAAAWHMHVCINLKTNLKHDLWRNRLEVQS